ncbi:hypothetical protein MNBD_GAMMA21-2553 [hydrothermal vent metagenome]|uniref:HDOD domain-containing protein n=1 Tax=hydrothermal vent metagenome TaxID=652676 RepID=A0A3B1A012_9ZZZZ
MPSKIPSELIGNNLKLLSLPAVVEKINRLLEDPNSTTADIAHYISQDPVLTARLLKLVNSPFYNFPSEIDTISMAVTILGTRQLRDLVFVTTVISQFTPHDDVNFDLEAFWCHSITAGIAARVIALNQKNLNSERLFICGLLHDIGKMIMALLLPQEVITLNKANLNKEINIYDAESQIFGYTHGEWATALLESWHFPASISEPIHYHHNPEESPEFKTDSAVIHIANVIANNIQAPISKDDDTLLQQAALDTVGITQNDIEGYYEQVYELLDNVLQMLYYDLAA